MTAKIESALLELAAAGVGALRRCGVVAAATAATATTPGAWRAVGVAATPKSSDARPEAIARIVGVFGRVLRVQLIAADERTARVYEIDLPSSFFADASAGSG